MDKQLVAFACLVGCLLGCGTPPASPAKTPEPDTTEPEKATAPEPTASEAVPPKETAADKPPCSSLQKAKCKVTMGCAWYEQSGKNKCVDE